jgi:hypothetical protein
MKKILATIFVVMFLFTGTAWAAGEVVQTAAAGGYASYPHNKDMRTATFTVTPASGAVTIHEFEQAETIYGYYLLSVEMKVDATDDVMVVLITTNTGAPLFTHTTTAALTGELENATDRWPINAAPKIDITGLTDAKVATVIVTFVR